MDRIIDSFPEQKQKQIRTQLAESLQAIVSQQLLSGKEGGLVAAVEVMHLTPAIRNLIRKGETGQMYSYIQTGAQYGMQTMESAVNRLRKEGKIESVSYTHLDVYKRQLLEKKDGPGLFKARLFDSVYHVIDKWNLIMDNLNPERAN